jgi:hypothetical protein
VTHQIVGQFLTVFVLLGVSVLNVEFILIRHTNGWRLVVSFTHWPLYSQGRSSRYPLDRRLGEPQSRSGPGGEEKNSQPPPGIEP